MHAKLVLSAYLLVERQGHADALADLAAQANNEGGQAWVVEVVPRSAADNEAFQALFDRSSEYAEMNAGLTQARKALPSQIPAEITKTLKRLRKERDALLRIDFFPNQASLLRLVSAVLIELSEEWETAKRYVTFDAK